MKNANKITWQGFPLKIRRQIKYLGKGEGYKIKYGKRLSPETYASKTGAAASLCGIWSAL
jgi:hypothetical protein